MVHVNLPLAPLSGRCFNELASFQLFVATRCISIASSLSSSYFALLSSEPSVVLLPIPGAFSKSVIKSPLSLLPSDPS